MIEDTIALRRRRCGSSCESACQRLQLADADITGIIDAQFEKRRVRACALWLLIQGSGPPSLEPGEWVNREAGELGDG